jgi:hypothetical protein
VRRKKQIGAMRVLGEILRANNQKRFPLTFFSQKITKPPSPLLFREQRTGMDVAHFTPFQWLIRLH